MADSYQLQQVILNLLMNAEQALLGGRSRGLVKIRTWFSKRGSIGRICLEVSDNGAGIRQRLRPEFLIRSSQPNLLEWELV